MSSFYAVVPAWLLANRELTPLDKLLCAVISGLSQKSGYCYADNEQLGDCLGIGKDAAKKALGRLTQKQIIKNVGGKFERKLILSFIESSKDTKGQNIPFDETKGQNDPLKGQNIPFVSILYSNNNITSSAQPNDTDFFTEFWNIYPRKSNKAAAKKKFNRLSAAKQQHIINLTRHFTDDMRNQGRSEEHILLPTTYLNQERYLDYEQEQEKAQNLAPNEGAASSVDIITEKIKLLVKKYEESQTQEQKEALNVRPYESFEVPNEGAFFSAEELEALRRSEASIADFAELETVGGEIRRMMRSLM